MLSTFTALEVLPRSPKVPKNRGHLSVQYHCLVSLESRVQASKVVHGETAVIEDLQGPCSFCVEIKGTDKFVLDEVAYSWKMPLFLSE